MNDVRTLTMELRERSYNIVLGSGILKNACELFNLDRSVVIVTDSGVPEEYSQIIAACCKRAKIFTFPCGEESKNLDTYANILKAMMEFGIQRKDAVVAVGGGVVGDIAGFAASSYMRGVDFYNVPTTLLSQVDSSIGGKCAVDLDGVKNIVGAFYQPKGVLIDTEVLKTLDKRQLACGKAEIIKMAICKDEELFERIVREGICDHNLADIILDSLKIKKSVVEVDEREGGLRKILNFGHTLGHGIEATTDYLHGEAVALGMIPMCSPEVRKKLIPVLKNEGLPYEFGFSLKEAFEFMKHDKKGDGRAVDAILVRCVGKCDIERISTASLEKAITEQLV